MTSLAAANDLYILALPCPALSLLGQVKLTTWMMINGWLRPTYLQNRGGAARPRTSAEDIRETCSE